MLNTYDKANEFERALRESDEYKASLAAAERLYVMLYIQNSCLNKKI